MSDVESVPANNPRRFWSKFKNALPKLDTKSIPSDLSADTFNAYFTNIPVSIDAEFDKATKLKWSGQKSLHSFSFSRISQESVYTQLSALGTTSNLDVLGFDSKLLQLSCNIICSPLTTVLNASLSTGLVHSDWKKARVTPIFKGGDDASVDDPSD